MYPWSCLGLTLNLLTIPCPLIESNRKLTFLFEEGNRFSFRFGVSVVDLTGVDVIGEAVVVVAVVDRLGVLSFGNGGLSFFCLLESPTNQGMFL